MASINIGDQLVGPNQPTFVIAEAGVNHNGELSLALDLVEAAADAGADAVKFQTFQADRLASPEADKASYQEQTTRGGGSQREMLEGLALGGITFEELQEEAHDLGLTFLSSPFDRQSLDQLVDLGVPAIKVPSGEITNRLLLDHIAKTGLPTILSTGMSHLDEVARAVRLLEARDHGEIVLLHCVSEYPVAPDYVNLRAMDTLREAFHLPTGLSDHTLGIEVPIAAVARGACVVEKHFTLDKAMEGPDHHASLEPNELSRLIDGIRAVEASLGDGRKRPVAPEIENRKVVRKSLGLARDRPKGSRLEADDLVPLRPATGISPWVINQIVGRELATPKEEGSILKEEDLR